MSVTIHNVASFVRLTVSFVLVASLGVIPIQSANSAIKQKVASPGVRHGTGFGGDFTSSCPTGSVVTSVAVSTNASFGYTTGFSFTCSEIDNKGRISDKSRTYGVVTNSVRDVVSTCSSSAALRGIKLRLELDPGDPFETVFYVRGLASQCAEFFDGREIVSAGMAIGVPDLQTKDALSTCSQGFVTGFAGRRGAGLDNLGVLCSIFYDDSEYESRRNKFVPSLQAISSPSISLLGSEIICKSGDYFSDDQGNSRLVAPELFTFTLMNVVEEVDSITSNKPLAHFSLSRFSNVGVGPIWCDIKAVSANKVSIVSSLTSNPIYSTALRDYKVELRIVNVRSRFKTENDKQKALEEVKMRFYSILEKNGIALFLSSEAPTD